MKVAGKVARLSFVRSLVHATAVFIGFLLFYTLFFAPVLCSDQLLAFGDGINYFLPAYYGPKTLWTNVLFGGYPIAADPQNMTWYPPALLLSWVPGSWNVFVMLAYVLAASFAYCYVYSLTASRLAGVVAGLAYSMSGFMMAHLTMIGMVNAAAWIPLLICALEKLRHRLQRSWLVIGVIAFVCCFLGGHPQISVYGLGLGVFYALFLGWGAPIGRWKYYRYAFGMMAIGIGICAIQLLPAAELSRLSLRSELTVGGFLNGSLPFWQSLQYIFPFLFGSGIALPPYRLPYWGEEANIVDIATYVGILPLILSAVGLSAYGRRGVIRFWLWVATITILIIFGRYFFFARLLYHVPVYNAFRIPARHAIELAMAVSVLAGFGIAAIQQRKVSSKMLRRIIGGSLLVLLLALAVLAKNARYFRAHASRFDIKGLTLWPWDNPAVGLPIIIFLTGLVAIALWNRWPRSIGSIGILLMVLTIDLASFGFWFHDWPNIGPKAAKLAVSPTIQKYRQALEQNQSRLVITSGITSHLVPDPEHPIFTNITLLWDLPIAGGYSPLILTRVSEMMQINNHGMLGEAAIDVRHRGLDLMAGRYLLAQQGQLGTDSFSDFPAAALYVGHITGAAQSQAGLLWSRRDLGITLAGAEAPAPQYSARIDLPNMVGQTTGIALVTALGNAVGIANDTAIMSLEVIDTDGSTEIHPLLAGRDTAEQAYDCPDVKPQMQHSRAEIFQTVAVQRSGVGTCTSNLYKSIIQLNKPRDIKRLRLYWNGSPASLVVNRISLLDSRSNTVLPIHATARPKTKWKAIEGFPHGVMYENQQVLPRAWVVPAVVELQPQEILQAIRTSRLPNGETYQPEQIAMVETHDPMLDDLKKPISQNRWNAQASVLKAKDTQVEIQTDAPSSALLVLSDVNYPGWQAWVDGQPAPIFQTNYVQRGVKIPAGKHVVRFEFHPFSFNLGAGIAAASLLGGLVWLIRMKTNDS